MTDLNAQSILVQHESPQSKWCVFVVSEFHVHGYIYVNKPYGYMLPLCPLPRWKEDNPQVPSAKLTLGA